jgi:hypothetical protein
MPVEATGQIGPHNHIELQLMLEGTKPLAVFFAEEGMPPEIVGDAEFDRYVQEERIIRFIEDFPERGYQLRAYCLPSEEWRAKLRILMARQGASLVEFRELFSAEDLHRMDGFLLGYDKTDVEAFIALSKANQVDR